ncbi:MAG TPA: CBS domain-containing protein [Polyangia bacterium]
MRSVSASVVGEDATPRLILAAMDRAGVDELPVASRDGVMRGMVERRAVERRLYDRGEDETPAAAIAAQPIARVMPDDLIERAADEMLADELAVLPVVSAHGQIEGLLVLDDIREVPELLEAVDDRRHRRAAVAEAGFRNVMIGCSVASVLLGMVLFAFWVSGPAYGLPNWIAWVDGLAALLAFLGAVLAWLPGLYSVPIWAIAGFGVCFAAASAHVWHDSAWATSVQLVFGVVFLVMVGIVGSALPRRRHRPLSVAA